MNKKQKEAKRKNAQAHQKKVRELGAQRENALIARRKELGKRELFKAERVIVEAPKPATDPVSDVFEKFFAEKLKQGSGLPLTADLVTLMKMTDPRLCSTCNPK